MRPQLDRLLKEEQPIYVRNQTNPRGQIVITFHDSASGKTIAVHIPRTTIPWCVSDFVSSDVINASSDFRRFITKGIVELLDPEDAETELQDEDIQEELEELRTSNHGLSRYSNFAKRQPKAKEGIPQFQGIIEDPVSNPVSPRIMNVMVGVDSGDMGVRQAMRELKSMEDQLSEEDLSYLLAESTRGGKIHEFASKQLAEMNFTETSETESTVAMADEKTAEMLNAPKPRTRRSRKKTSD